MHQKKPRCVAAARFFHYLNDQLTFVSVKSEGVANADVGTGRACTSSSCCAAHCNSGQAFVADGGVSSVQSSAWRQVVDVANRSLVEAVCCSHAVFGDLT